MNRPSGWCASEGTLAHELMITGHGLHTGRNVNVRILPRDGSHGQRGISFKRMRDGRTLAEMAVGPQLRYAQPLCTTLKSPDGVTVRTVEHLLAALLACEIDHAVVELDAEEVPILDGSATPWIKAIRACGRVSSQAPKRFIRVLKPVEVTDGSGDSRRELRLDPAPNYGFSVRDDMKGFGDLQWQGEMTPAVFASQIAASRSYGRVKWAVPAIAAGYLFGKPILRGARISCAAAIVGNRVLGGMRMEDEFVRHRVLDLVGDLALLGAPLLGHVSALRPCHEMNYRLVSVLLSTPGAWEWEICSTAASAFKQAIC